MQTLSERVIAGARGAGSVTFVSGDTSVTVPWADLHQDAVRTGSGLEALGVGPGDRVGLLAPTSRDLVTAVQAVWLRGATVVVLPLPMRLASFDSFAAQTLDRVRSAGVALVVADPVVGDLVAPGPQDPPFVGFADLARVRPGTHPAPRPDPDALAILQFTSGSTSDPKGVSLPHRTVCANLDAIASSVALDPGDDVVASWLPLYHDMGLVGVLALTMTTGTELVLGAPQDFMADPGRWMRWVSDHRATATAGPNFAWALAARALRRADRGPAPRDIDLSSLRIALSGAEPVDPVTVREFVDAARPFGFDPRAVFPAFGMAEVAIAATFPPVGRGVVTDVVDLDVLQRERRALPCAAGTGSRELVRLGRPVSGLEIRVVDPRAGRPLDEREVGEVELRGTSVCAGYDGRPELDAALFRHGWLRTGDLGYLVDGELVVCGRLKDVIVVGGRNVFAEDVERACAEVDGVRPGNVVAFGVERPGARGARREGVVVVAETRFPGSVGTERELRSRVTDVTGVAPRDVVLVAPGTVPKTSSGKLQRSACRDEYLSGNLRTPVGVAI